MGRHKAFRREKDQREGSRGYRDTKTRQSVAQAPRGRDSDHRWDPPLRTWAERFDLNGQWVGEPTRRTRCLRCGCLRTGTNPPSYERGGLNWGNTPPPCRS